MNHTAPSRPVFHLLVIALLAVAVLAVAIVAHFGLAVLGILGLVLTLAVFAVMLAFTAGN
ncbi:hypothetical protein [Paracoccus rhizosphaerae]|uniref:Uncharacterized protein n=1 Tax=Paracoccus rhizosphaerae TaxID=1133347 RepID=A0ABV6CJU0_9RHOB|nr:hypothetical protein [Paracoccus rhizosphaerae]